MDIPINSQFKYWTVLGPAPSLARGSSVERRFLCRCICGKKRIVSGRRLRAGKSKSCGCYQKEIARQAGSNKTTHAHSRKGKVTRIYRIWLNMNTRCNNPNFPAYKRYGAKGVHICLRWRTFENFLADMGEPPTLKHSIDRIDSNGNYEPENCRWATPEEQANNTKTNHFLKYNDQIKTIAQWAKFLHVPRYKLQDRIIKLKWTVERAFTTP